jgi:hypothetical protein
MSGFFYNIGERGFWNSFERVADRGETDKLKIIPSATLKGY